MMYADDKIQQCSNTMHTYTNGNVLKKTVVSVFSKLRLSDPCEVAHGEDYLNTPGNQQQSARAGSNCENELQSASSTS